MKQEENQAEITQYQDYFVETTTDYEKELDIINRELVDTREALKDLAGIKIANMPQTYLFYQSTTAYHQ